MYEEKGLSLETIASRESEEPGLRKTPALWLILTFWSENKSFGLFFSAILNTKEFDFY